jgi:hypothetical protein
VLLGFSYWKNGNVNWFLVKVVSIFIDILHRDCCFNNRTDYLLDANHVRKIHLNHPSKCS